METTATQKPWYMTLSLAGIETAYRNGSVDKSEMDAYLEAWNTTPGRFTFAYWQDGAIRQRNID